MARFVALRSIYSTLKRFRYFVVYMLLVGGDANISSTPTYAEDLPELKMYVARFYRLSKIYMPPSRHIVPMNEIVFQFGSLRDEEIMVGVCQRPDIKSLSSPMVTIDRRYWKTASPVVKEQLVFHELGHCALDRPHDETIVFDFLNMKVGNSIMYPLLDAVPELVYTIDREHYLTELFNGK